MSAPHHSAHNQGGAPRIEPDTSEGYRIALIMALDYIKPEDRQRLLKRLSASERSYRPDARLAPNVVHLGRARLERIAPDVFVQEAAVADGLNVAYDTIADMIADDDWSAKPAKKAKKAKKARK